MSLDTALSGALSSLKTVQQQIALVSNNINNANTPGYSRKTANLSSIGDGVLLVGVKISDYQRATDKTLLKQLNASLAESGFKSAQQQYLDQIQDILGSSRDNVRLAKNLEAFASSWRQLQAEPENTALQSQVISSGNGFASEVRRLASQVEQLDRAIQSDIQTGVGELNTALKDIEKINGQISQALAVGTPIGDYEDQRDVALQKIAQYVEIRVLERGNGQISIYTPQGYALLDGKPQQFDFNAGIITIAGSSTVVNDNLRSGRLQALLALRADTSPAAAAPDATQEVIRKLREQLDSVVNGFLTATTPPDSFAQAYNSATGNTGALATGFFTGTDRTDFSVNASLLNGSATVKRAAAVTVSQAMQEGTRSFTAFGQTSSNLTYSGFAEEITAYWQTGAKRADDEAQTATSQKDYFQKLFTDKSGVNVDQELISLQTLQRSYQAAARLVNLVQQLNQTIIDMVGR
jgi:flagellar hook-associated protein 1